LVSQVGLWVLTAHSPPENPAVPALAVHPAKPNNIYADSQREIHRSADHGGTLRNVPEYRPPIPPILLWPDIPDISGRLRQERPSRSAKAVAPVDASLAARREQVASQQSVAF